MLLRESSDHADEQHSQIPGAAELIGFVEAVLGSTSDIGGVRNELARAVGGEGLVDAAAVLAHFQQLDRVADATGVDVDALEASLGR